MTPPPPPPARKPLSLLKLVLIVLGIAVACCALFSAAVARSAWKFQDSMKFTECKNNLLAVSRLEKAYREKQNSYSENAEVIGFDPTGSKYLYLLAQDGVPVGIGPDAYADGLRARMGGLLGVQGRCPDCTFTAGCAGNLDADPDVDVWSISNADRKAKDGTRIPGGVPWHDFNDLD